MFCAISACRVPAWWAMADDMRKMSRFSNIGASPSIGFNQGLTVIPLKRVCGKHLELPMTENILPPPTRQIAGLKAVRPLGRVSAVQGHALCLSGLSGEARLGDRVRIERVTGPLHGEVVQLEESRTVILPDEAPVGVALGDSALLLDAATISPAPGWIGRVIDPFGNPLDRMPLASGQVSYPEASGVPSSGLPKGSITRPIHPGAGET